MLNQPHAGKALQQARFSQNLTLDQLSAKANVAVATIVRIEKGEGAYGRTIHSLAAALDVDPSSLFIAEPEVESA